MENQARPSRLPHDPNGVGTTIRSITPRCGRSGFTLLEAVIVNALMVFLAMLVSTAWSAFGRPTADVIARCRVTQEANLAAASLARDLGGSLANHEGRIGGKLLLRYVGRMQPAKKQLWLCFDGGPNPNGQANWGTPDTVISYEVQSNRLIRWDQTAGTSVIVARDVDQLTLKNHGSKVEIKLTFKYRQITRTYTLMALDP